METWTENNQRYTPLKIVSILKISKSITLLVKVKNMSFIFHKKLNEFFGQPNIRFFHPGQALNFISFPGALCCHQRGSSVSGLCTHSPQGLNAGFGIGLFPRFLALPLFEDSVTLTVMLVFIQNTGLLTITRTITTAFTICLISQKETSYAK